MPHVITYDTFLSKSCNTSNQYRERNNNWTRDELIKFCNELNIGDFSSSRLSELSKKQLCAKIFKYFFIKMKGNPELTSPESYNVIISQSNILDATLIGISTLPNFIPNTFYYNEVKAITDILDVQYLIQADLIKYAMLIICIKTQVSKIPNELDIQSAHVESSYPSTPRPVSIQPRVSSLSRQMPVPSEISEEDSMDFSDTNSDSESISDDMQGCVNESVISLEPFDINSNDIFTMYYLNNSNKFANGTCVSKSEMKNYIESEEDESPSLFTTIWKGGDKTGIGGKPTCKFIVKMPPNNIWITLGSFDKMMNSNEKSWYLLPLYSNKRRRIGFQYGVGRNHGQTPGSIIYKCFTKQEIKNNIKVIETIYDYPLYLRDLTLSQIDSTNIIRSIKNQFL